MASDDFQKMLQKYNDEIKEMRKLAKPETAPVPDEASLSSDEYDDPDPIINGFKTVMATPAEQAPQRRVEGNNSPVTDEAGQFPFSNNFEYPSIPREQAIEGATSDLNGEGKLMVRVFTARGAAPVVGATVIISQQDENGEKLIASTFTDIDGETKIYDLPTVSAEKSLTPGDKNPYAAYKIRVTSEGYFSIDGINVPVFDKQTAVQPVEMIPLPENFSGNETLNSVQTGPITL